MRASERLGLEAVSQTQRGVQVHVAVQNGGGGADAATWSRQQPAATASAVVSGGAVVFVSLAVPLNIVVEVVEREALGRPNRGCVAVHQGLH